MTIPPWLQIDPSSYLRAAEAGAQTGLQVGHLRQSAAALAQQAAESQANREFAQQKHADDLALQSWEANQRSALAAQELAQRNAYQTGELGYRTGMLNYHMGKEAQAEKLQSDIDADTGDFLKEISAGENLDESLGRHPLASHNTTVRTLLTQDAISKRGGPVGQGEIVDLGEISGRPELRGKLGIREPTGHLRPLPSEKELNVTYASPEMGPTGQPTFTLRGPQSQVEPYMGTNAPSYKLPGKGGKRVRVQSASGKIGTIPAEQLDDAIAAGYKPL